MTIQERLVRFVENLLRRIYAYVSWGPRQQAESEWKWIEHWKSLVSSSLIVWGDGTYSISSCQRFFWSAGITMMFWLLTDVISTS